MKANAYKLLVYPDGVLNPVSCCDTVVTQMQLFLPAPIKKQTHKTSAGAKKRALFRCIDLGQLWFPHLKDHLPFLFMPVVLTGIKREGLFFC